jgi:AraC-like DNA-binding protein/quercetin dioxygenase-like cupin family protein
MEAKGRGAEGGRLYKRAAPAPASAPESPSRELDALWHLDAGRTLFIGPLDYNASHQHGAPVFVTGLYGKFGLRVEGGPWRWVRAAVIPAGVRHELQLGGMPLGVLYIEPNLAGTEALTPLVRGSSASEEGGALIGTAGEVGAFRALYESRTATRWAGEALGDLLGFARAKARKAIDPRIAGAVVLLSSFGLGPLRSVDAVAAQVGLSGSRFQHLFTREVGVPFRRYRAWQRMRGAIAEIVRGSSFGRAAHLAGFADQAHFGRDFRRTFGAAASRSLGKVRFRPSSGIDQRVAEKIASRTRSS